MRSLAEALPTLDPGRPAPTPDGPRAHETSFDPSTLLAVLTKAAAGPHGRGGPGGPGERGTDGPSPKALWTDGVDEQPTVVRPTAATSSAQKPASVPPFVTQTSVRSAIPPLDGAQAAHDPVEEALAKAHEEAEAKREAAVAAARREERERAETALATARQEWCEGEVAALKERCEAAYEDLHARLSKTLAAALAPIAREQIRAAAIRHFAAVLDELAGPAADAAPIRVSGPADLLDALRRASPEASITFETLEGASDLSANVDQTRLETAIAAWSEDLTNALGDGDEG